MHSQVQRHGYVKEEAGRSNEQRFFIPFSALLSARNDFVAD